MIDAINNLFLKTYQLYTGRVRTTGAADAKHITIHFYTAKKCDECVNGSHLTLHDLKFHSHDPKQIKLTEDQRAIQVTDILLFIKKEDVLAVFKRYGNIESCRLHARSNSKVQQARIVYDNADSITHFAIQWAVYCYSTCLRITPCYLSLEQKKAQRKHVVLLT